MEFGHSSWLVRTGKCQLSDCSTHCDDVNGFLIKTCILYFGYLYNNFRGPKVDDCKFEVRCTAKPNGELHVKTNSLSVAISQGIYRNGREEMWESILIICQREEDGTLNSRVIVSHPDWDHNLQVASLKSSSLADAHSNSAMECDLKTVAL
jgi:hypothetical protein